MRLCAVFILPVVAVAVAGFVAPYSCYTGILGIVGLWCLDYTYSFTYSNSYGHYGYHRHAHQIQVTHGSYNSYFHTNHRLYAFAAARLRPTAPNKFLTTQTHLHRQAAHRSDRHGGLSMSSSLSLFSLLSSQSYGSDVEPDATEAGATTEPTAAAEATTKTKTDNLLARLQSILPTNSTYRKELLEIIQQEHQTSALQHELLDQEPCIQTSATSINSYCQNKTQDTVRAGIDALPPTTTTTTTTTTVLPRLKDIVGNQGQRIAFVTETPLLTTDQASFIQELITDWWNNKTHSTSTPSSRYTYPRACNQEAHLLDLCQWNETMLHMTRDVLHTQLYPLIRQHYLLNNNGNEESTANDIRTTTSEWHWEPRLYDSLFIRYNAVNHTSTSFSTTTTSSQHQHPSLQEEAGLPFHRDMGLVSINIMLNSKDVSFRGGGTVFEALDGGPIIPSGGIGHALLHQSNQRHAAAITTHGTRDIWVLFVTALNVTNTRTTNTTPNNTINNGTPRPPPPPPQEVASRLKRKASQDKAVSSDPWKRAFLLKFAIEADPTDGDAWHHLGMALHAIRKFPKETRACLSRATRLIPNDARLFHNFGTVLWSQQQEQKDDEEQEQPHDDPIDFLEERIEICFRRALQLYQGHVDHAGTVYNYGSFLAHQTRWDDAIQILSSTKECYAQDADDDKYDLNYIRSRILELQQVCNQNLLSASTLHG